MEGIWEIKQHINIRINGYVVEAELAPQALSSVEFYEDDVMS